MVVYDYLKNNNVEEHISKIRNLYRSKRNLMIDMIKKYFPKEVNYTEPEGVCFYGLLFQKKLIH